MYRATWYISHALCLALLVNHSPFLEDLTIEVLNKVRQGNVSAYLKSGVFSLARVLAHLGIIPQPLTPAIQEGERFGNHDAQADISATWLTWFLRWRNTSTLSRGTRMGRWLAKNHPEAVDPKNWTRKLAVEYVAAVDRMTVGEWVQADKMHRG